MLTLEVKFEIKLAAISDFVGMRISLDRDAQTVTISQSNYLRQLLGRFGMLNAKPASTPMDKDTQLTKPEKDTSEPDVSYRQAVGALLFAAMVNRPDITFAIGQVSRYSSHFD